MTRRNPGKIRVKFDAEGRGFVTLLLGKFPQDLYLRICADIGRQEGITNMTKAIVRRVEKGFLVE